MPKPRRNLRPELHQLDRRCLLSTVAGLTPSQLTSAYGLNGISFPTSSGQTVPGNGAGQTIALIEMYHDPNLASDLSTFDQRFGLPDPSLNVINQAGNQVDSSWGQEESLDVEVAHAVAPAASIVVVEAAPGITNDQMLQNLMTAVRTASLTPGVTVVSMSWGFNEFPGETQYDSYFTTPGVTYIAASGDTASVDYPAASPDVLSVGGTTLNLGASGAYVSESAWYDSGGGYSLYEAEPSYQMSVQASGMRSTPDVAFDGDPNTGLQVYFTPPSGQTVGQWAQSQGSWATFGGTSLGAPAWAGLIAIVNQGRLLTGKPSLTGPEQTLPSLYALAANSYHAVAPTTITSPWTGGGFAGWGGFGNWSGYDGGNGIGNS
ncbi:MAG: S53 family peptidase, partial [Isosphaeraceae bacterium]